MPFYEAEVMLKVTVYADTFIDAYNQIAATIRENHTLESEVASVNVNKSSITELKKVRT